MKTITDIINERKEGLIDMEWIDNEMPVKTADGNPAIVVNVDMSKVPNVIIGKVKIKDKLVDYQWDDKGLCIKATDQYGNPKMPHESDNLVKDIVK